MIPNAAAPQTSPPSTKRRPLRTKREVAEGASPRFPTGRSLEMPRTTSAVVRRRSGRSSDAVVLAGYVSATAEHAGLVQPKSDPRYAVSRPATRTRHHTRREGATNLIAGGETAPPCSHEPASRLMKP